MSNRYRKEIVRMSMSAIIVMCLSLMSAASALSQIEKTDSNPEKKAVAPVKKEVAPEKKAAVPAKKAAAPAQKAAVPVQKPAAPAQKAVAPVQKPAAPAQIVAAPEQKTIIPEKKDVSAAPPAPAEKKDAAAPEKKEVLGAEKKEVKSDAKVGHKPAGKEAEILKALADGKPLKEVLHSMVKAGMPVQDFVAAAIKAGVDSSSVVYTSVKEGYSTQIVVRSALKAGAHIDAVIAAALRAGGDKKAIYIGAAEAGASPGVVGKALNTDPQQGGSHAANKKSVPAASRFASEAPAIFGAGGIILQELPGRGNGNLRLGAATINPFISIRETMTDNAFFSSSDKKKDTITTIIPGARGSVPFGANKAELEAYAVINQYSKYTDANTKLWHADGAITFNEGKQFEFRVSEYHARDQEPASSTPAGAIVLFQTNTAAAEAKYQFNDKWRMMVNLGLSGWTFDGADNFRNREETAASATVFYNILKKSAAFVELGYKNVKYSQTVLELDSTESSLQAGLSWNISARAKGTVKAGLLTKNFKSALYKDGTVKIGAADIRYDVTSKASFVLTAQRSLNETNVPGLSHTISTGGFGEFKYKFVPMLAGVVRASYVQDNGILTDRTSLGGLGLKYKPLNWFEVALDYNQTKRDSADPLRDYTENASMLTLNVSY